MIVPKKDIELFRSLETDRTSVLDVQSFLPSSMRPVPYYNLWVNLRHPFPPVRGWIAQQIVKIGIVASLNTDLVMVADSDLVFIRRIDPLIFAPSGKLQLYRVPDGINESLPRHRIWHDVARKLLGLGTTPPGKLVDYICCPCVWSPYIVRQMVARIEAVTNSPWQTAIGRELHFSEMILYGLFVDEVLNEYSIGPSTDDMHCLNHYEESPLRGDELSSFLKGSRATDIAVMISAKSGTNLDERRDAIDRYVGVDLGENS